MISIASMKHEIQSSDEQQVVLSLKKLCDLCETSEIVRSLARKVEESMLALQLLLELSRSTHVRNLIGSAQGCILLLVTLANSDDSQAYRYSREVLDNLAFLDENVVQMARVKYFKPLLERLSEEPIGVHMVMAETLADLELTDHNKMCLSRDGALKPLLEMLHHSDMEVKAVAVRALLNLSGVAANGLQMIKEGAKIPLFELLFCHSLSSSKLREQVAKTIMHLAMATTSSEEQILLLETGDDIFKLFSLVSYTGPDTQATILLTFHALCKSPFGFDIRKELRQMCVVKVLSQLCELDELAVRANAVKLFFYLTQDGDHPTFEEHVNKTCLTTLVKIIKTSTNEEETAAAMGIISNLPHSAQMSQHLLDSGALEVIFHCLKFKNVHTPNEKEVIKNAAKALCRFTVPSNLEWQKTVAEADMIPVLVKLLASGTPSTKQYIGISLKQFSESSSSLSIPVKTSRLLSCFTSSANTCPIHKGICGIKSSFCLLEAKAVRPLVEVLKEVDANASEASLDAILTLIDGIHLQSGCKVLEEADAILPIIRMLNSSSTSLQEKTLGALQRIFRLVDLKTKYGKSAQMSLVDIIQRGSSNAKSLAAKILAQLNVLNEQSSFIDGNV